VALQFEDLAGILQPLTAKDQLIKQCSARSWMENGWLTYCNVRFSLNKLNDGKVKNIIRSTSYSLMVLLNLGNNVDVPDLKVLGDNVTTC
jgi:hypothetical protein